MKNNCFFLFLALICLSQPVAAQDNWVSYAQSVETEGREGRRFRFEAAIRAEIDDDSAAAHLWARVDKKNGTAFFENMGNRPVRSREWKTYTIEGRIDSGSYQLAFGAWCQFNGTFFLDEVKLSIETEKDKWTTVLADGFESADFDNWKQGIRRWEESGNGFNTLYHAEVNADNPFKGRQCLKITGKNVPNYGENNKAGKHLDVNGIRLYYESYGAGQPLVIIHTSGSSIADAALFIPELAKSHRVIAFDSRGHGNSSGRDTRDPTYTLMADDIAKALTQLGVDSACIWGFSDGAIMALLLATEYPHLVKKLLAGVPNVLPDTTAVHPIIHQYMTKIAGIPEDSDQRKLARWMLSPSGLSFEKMKTIQCPVLLVTGDRDWVKLEHTLRIFQTIPHSQLCVLPGATHRSAWEKREMFLQVATAFFDKPFEKPDTKDWFRD